MKLVSYGLSFGDLIDALESNNVAQGAKYIEENGEAYQVRASGLLQTIEEIEDIVIGQSGGTPVLRARRRRRADRPRGALRQRERSTARRR